MKSSSILPFLSFLSLTSALQWEFDASSVTCNGSPFLTPELYVSCNDSPSCTLGDTAYISGNLTAGSEFDSNSYVVLQPCVIAGDYEYCPKKYAYSAGGVCQEWLTSDSVDCGQVGDYVVDYSVTIPNKLPEYFEWLGYASQVVTVKVEVKSDVKCEVSYYGEYHTVYSMMGLAVGIVCAGAYARKRKGQGEENTDGEVRENDGGDYIEMLSGRSESITVV